MEAEFCLRYPQLEPAQQGRFRMVVTRLLSGKVIGGGTALNPDPEWRFAERHRDLLDGYLRIGGWRLDLDPTLRLCRAVHENGEQRVRFNKFESLTLCLLRLAYHERMRDMREEDRCALRTGELRERMIQAGKAAHQAGRRPLLMALRALARRSIVELPRQFSGEDEESFIILPLIEKVLPPDRIAEMVERVKAYTQPTPETNAQEDAADGEDEPAPDPREEDL